jgi:hypothetical protein
MFLHEFPLCDPHYTMEEKCKFSLIFQKDQYRE